MAYAYDAERARLGREARTEIYREQQEVFAATSMKALSPAIAQQTIGLSYCPASAYFATFKGEICGIIWSKKFEAIRSLRDHRHVMRTLWFTGLRNGENVLKSYDRAKDAARALGFKRYRELKEKAQ